MMKNRLSGKNNNPEYFKLIEVNSPEETEKELEIGGGITKQILIEWKHSKHGRQKVLVNLYKNPQVQNGISYKSQLYDRKRADGLMVKSATSSNYELRTLTGGRAKTYAKNKKLIQTEPVSM